MHPGEGENRLSEIFGGIRAILRTTGPENERTYRVKSSDFTRMSAVPVFRRKFHLADSPFPACTAAPYPPPKRRPPSHPDPPPHPAPLSNFVERICWEFWSIPAIMFIDLVLTQKYQSEEGSIKNYVR